MILTWGKGVFPLVVQKTAPQFCTYKISMMSELLNNKKNIQHLVAKYGSPLAIFESAKLREQYLSLQAAMPNVDLHFAVKSLPKAEVVATLQQMNAYFDVATIGEIKLLEENNTPAHRCIFTHPIKKNNEIEIAIAFGIRIFVVDNEAELEKFIPYKDKVKLLLRISFPNDEAEIKLFEKFGTTISGAVHLLQLSQFLEIDICGISFHVGSRMQRSVEYVNCIEQCAQLFNWAKDALGMQLTLLDIGGGFPCFNSETDMEREQFFEPINKALLIHFPKTRIIAEPGRSVANACVSIVSTVVGKCKKEGKYWYYLDDGVYGSFSGQCFDGRKHQFKVLKNEIGELQPCVFVGPTCDSFDTIDKNLLMPELDINDMLLVENMGAYTLATSTHFNSIAPTYFVHWEAEKKTKLPLVEKQTAPFLCIG